MDYDKLFFELNERLKSSGKYLNIICGGGFALMINDIRATNDIDAFFDEDNWIMEQIRAIGEKYNVNVGADLWLNTSIKTFNKQPPQDSYEVFSKYSNLTVQVVTLNYLLGMKLFSQREKDIADAGEIIKKLEIEDPILVIKNNSNFNIDASNVLWAFELAYSEDWLEKYMIEHKEQIERYFR